MPRSGVWALLAAAMLTPGAARAGAPIVHTDAGAVIGRSEGPLDVYRGIPFAAPPIGPLRWRAPQPPARWAQPRPAIDFAAPCMQANASAALARPPSEDCLYLNVWTPARLPARARAGAKLPVLVWIHGGAFRAGATSDPRIAGDIIAARGVVVVTIAYRLGVIGYFSHPQLSEETPGHVSGNYGLFDQLAALRWVQRNIGAFGGDPARVTIGGMSAGAISTAMLAAMPAARGTFHAIISMSGGSFAPPRSPAEAGENMEPLAAAERHGVDFARTLDAGSIADLRAMPADRLIAAAPRGVGWPVIDGVAIPGDEYRLFAAGAIADVPLLLGTTSDEGHNFSQIADLAAFRAEVARRYGSFAPAVLAAYPANSDAEAVRQGRDLLRDVMFGWGTFTWAELTAKFGHHHAWVYYFDHAPPTAAGQPREAGAVHGADQPYPFGIAHQPRAWTPRDGEISRQMLDSFVNFVKTGDPNGAGAPAWGAYSPALPMALAFTDHTAMVPAPNAAQRGVIDAYLRARRDAGTLTAP